MKRTEFRLAFEQPIFDLQARLEKLEQAADKSPETHDEIRRLRLEVAALKKKIYSRLEPWQTVEVARHADRPMTSDYLNLVFDDFVELHGDRFFGDDRALVTGFAKLEHHRVLVVGHQKGKTVKEKTACYFGCAHPEGYRKAMLKMKLAAKFGMPVIAFIDTPGAYPGIGAEERGQAQVIAESMQLMSRLPTPIICIVIGEGGSGGALGIGVGDRVAMLEHAYYSVISPEGCAGILWKSHKFKKEAARALRITSRDLKGLGVVDDVIEEPLGGAHCDHVQTATRVKMYLLRSLASLLEASPDALLAGRYEKFRRMGQFLEQAAVEAEAATEDSVGDAELPSAPAAGSENGSGNGAAGDSLPVSERVSDASSEG